MSRGAEVSVLSLEPNHIPKVDVRSVKPLYGLWNLTYLRFLIQIKHVISAIRPDIVHAHYATSYGLLGVATNFHPLIVSVWGSDIFQFPRKSPLHRQLTRFVLEKADCVCATSEALRCETKKYTRNELGIVLTPFGVDLKTFRPATRTRAVDSPVTIGTVKLLEPVYGIEYLIRAFALISAKYPRVRLVIAGGGSLIGALRALASKLNLTDVITFTGQVPHQEVPNFLNEMDIFVIPSVGQESFGVVALEASATGLPVIASDVGGLNEVVVDGETGFLVPPGDCEAISEKIAILIEHPGLRHELGQNGIEFVRRRYGWTENASIMESLYLRLCLTPGQT